MYDFGASNRTHCEGGGTLVQKVHFLNSFVASNMSLHVITFGTSRTSLRCQYLKVSKLEPPAAAAPAPYALVKCGAHTKNSRS